MEKNVKNTSVNNINGGNTMIEKAKNYSEANVRAIARMAKTGSTMEDVTTLFGRTPQTIKRWLLKYYERPGNAKRVWEMLKINSINHTDNTAATEESVPAKTEIKPEINEVEVIYYVLDSQLIQRWDGRKDLPQLMEVLKSTGKKFVFHSKYRVEQFAKECSGQIQEYAQMIIDDPEIELLDEFYLEQGAMKINATVITNSEISAKRCKKAGAKWLMVKDFLSNSDSYKDIEDDQTLDFERKLSIPVELNPKRQKMIADFAVIQKFCAETYGIEQAKVTIKAADGKEKNSPKGRIRLLKGDQIFITGLDYKNHSINAVLEIISETAKENAIERTYRRNPATSKKTKAV